MSRPKVAQFFDDNARDYHGRAAGMQHHHRVTATRLAQVLRGEVLAVGGLWQDGAAADDTRLTIADLSAAMLREAPTDAHVRRVQADALDLPFRDASFDHVVLPLILHHLAGDSARQARDLVCRALRGVRRVLRPGGRVWISELCVSRSIYQVERASVPITRRVLGAVGIPLVVMHSQHFYLQALGGSGFHDAMAEPIVAEGAGPLDWITPVIGLPLLKVPRALYPVRPTLLYARR